MPKKAVAPTRSYRNEFKRLADIEPCHRCAHRGPNIGFTPWNSKRPCKFGVKPPLRDPINKWKDGYILGCLAYTSKNGTQ